MTVPFAGYIVIALTGVEIDGKKVGCVILSEQSLYLSIYSKVFGPNTYAECQRYVDENGFIIDPEDRGQNDEDRLSSPIVVRRIDIGSFDGVPETKTEWEGQIIQYPVFYTRRTIYVVYTEIAAPSDIVNDVWNDFVSCAIQSAGVGTLAAIFASPASFSAAFQAALLACMAGKLGDQADRVGAALGAETRHSDWARV